MASPNHLYCAIMASHYHLDCAIVASLYHFYCAIPPSHYLSISSSLCFSATVCQDQITFWIGLESVDLGSKFRPDGPRLPEVSVLQ